MIALYSTTSEAHFPQPAQTRRLARRAPLNRLRQPAFQQHRLDHFGGGMGPIMSRIFGSRGGLSGNWAVVLLVVDCDV